MPKDLQFVSVSGETKTHPVSSFFLNAVQPPNVVPDHENKNKLCGLNVGIALPHKDADAYFAFCKEFHGDTWEGFYNVLVCDDDDGMKMPVIIHGGNGYEKKMGTSCFFGYICPEMFDPRPEMKY